MYESSFRFGANREAKITSRIFSKKCFAKSRFPRHERFDAQFLIDFDEWPLKGAERERDEKETERIGLSSLQMNSTRRKSSAATYSFVEVGRSSSGWTIETDVRSNVNDSRINQSDFYATAGRSRYLSKSWAKGMNRGN